MNYNDNVRNEIVVIDVEEKEVCSICIEPIDPDTIHQTIVPCCKNAFHTSCYQEYLDARTTNNNGPKTCPLCRVLLRQTETDIENGGLVIIRDRGIEMRQHINICMKYATVGCVMSVVLLFLGGVMYSIAFRDRQNTYLRPPPPNASSINATIYP